MNKFTGHIKDINSSDQMSLVTIQLQGDVAIQSLVIDTPTTAPYLQKGSPIEVLFKETEVLIGTSVPENWSIENNIAGHIVAIKPGKLLSRLRIETACGVLVALISTQSLTSLALAPDMAVVAAIKPNEVMLSPL